MAYAVSQLRKQAGTGTYMQTITVTESTFASPNKFNDSGSFTDFALLGNFEKGKTYYLRFIIHRIPDGWYSRETAGYYSMFQTADDMTYTLLLKTNAEEDEDTNPPQIIDTFTVKSLALSETNIGSNTVYYSYSTVFTPNKNFGLLGFRLARTAYDVLASQRNWIRESAEKVTKTVYDDSGKPMVLTTQGERIVYKNQNGDICLLKDIVGLSNSTTWLKMGFQSRPGTLVVVNQQPIRVGRNGTYQINNGTMIDSFMIAAPQGSDNSKIDAFLLDYAYNKS